MICGNIEFLKSGGTGHGILYIHRLKFTISIVSISDIDTIEIV